MKSGKGYIYLIRNNVNGKGYVGQTIRTIKQRWNQHKSAAKHGQGRALGSAIRKYDAENFTVKEVVSCDPSLLDDLEIHYIKFFGTHADLGHGYNLSAGGPGPFNPAVKTRERLSDAGKRRIPWNKGKTGLQKQSEETKEKRAAKLRGRKRPNIGSNMRKELPCSGGCGTMLSAQERQKRCPTCGASNISDKEREKRRKAAAKTREKRRSRGDILQRGTPEFKEQHAKRSAAQRKELPCEKCGTLLGYTERHKPCFVCGNINITEEERVIRRAEVNAWRQKQRQIKLSQLELT